VAKGSYQCIEVQIGTDLHMGKSREEKQGAEANIVEEVRREDGGRETKFCRPARGWSPTMWYELGIQEEPPSAQADLGKVCSIVKTSFLKCRGDKLNCPDASLDMTEPLRPAVQATVILTLVSTSPPEVHKTMLDKVKKEHDLGKAVKADDAQVLVYLWIEVMCRREPSDGESKALSILCSFFLRLDRWRLWREMRDYMVNKFGPEWLALARAGGNRGAVLKAQWWKRSCGRQQRMSGLNIPLVPHYCIFDFRLVTGHKHWKGSEFTTWMRDLLQNGDNPRWERRRSKSCARKSKRFINRRYIVPIPAKFKSSIKYFAILKGNDDWRIVFHAGANKLNEHIRALAFCLPSINLLLRIIDGQSLMSDHDMGDMFHNFPLNANTVKFTTIDLAPLELGPEECKHQWVCWKQNLMGFRSSP
jgi:hypothetical protein